MSEKTYTLTMSDGDRVNIGGLRIRIQDYSAYGNSSITVYGRRNNDDVNEDPFGELEIEIKQIEFPDRDNDDDAEFTFTLTAQEIADTLKEYDDAYMSDDDADFDEPESVYVALTTHNYQMSGMNIVVATGTDEEQVREEAERKISEKLVTEVGTDIYADTELKNLVVVSKTEAKRRYGFDWDNYQPYE